MKRINRQYKVYPYDELSEDAKERARSEFYDINVDFGDWYEYLVSEGKTAQALDDAGIKIDARGISFDLDRGSYLYFSPFRYSHKSKEGVDIKGEHQGIWLESPHKLAKALVKAKLLPRKAINMAERQESIYFEIDTSLYGGGGGKNHLYIHGEDAKGYDLLNSLSAEQADAIDDFLGDKLEDLLSELRSEYEHLTGREAIEDTIRANEYQFLEDGKLFS